MLNFFKPKHKHKWDLVACNDEYNTVYTDTSKNKNWHQRFYQCACGARKHEDDKMDFIQHQGIEAAKKNWIDLGVVPGLSYVPNESHGYYKITNAERKALDPLLAYRQTLQDMVDSLGVVINRDFKLEEKYPDLRDAANNYHRVLEQYRVIEILKDGRD